MSRRSGAGGKPAKSQRRKTAMLKHRNAPKAVHNRGVSIAGQETVVARLTHERDEALEQLAATSEILRVIRTSPTDVQPVFETIVRSAVSLCGSLFANVFRFDGEVLHWVASHNVGPSFVDLLKAKFPMRPDRSQVAGRVLLTKSVIRLENALTDPDYDQRFPGPMGWRRMLGVPMLREGDPVGVIVVGWAEAGPVPKAQEQLLKTFASQAVIAIENTRLLKELRQRTTDLAESLEQQTAASQVLSIISSSPAELEPVFQAILANATRLCGAKFAILNLYDGEVFRGVAFYNVPPEYAEMRLRQPEYRPHPRGGAAKVVRTKQPVQIDDLRTFPTYLEGDSTIRAMVDVGGARTLLLVPILKDDALVGLIGIYRKEVQRFTDKQIALVQNFAAQAVIAIQNARLLNELRQRTTDLAESLEQQTATSQVLSIISSSPAELESVFQAILANATRLCGAKFAGLSLYDGEAPRFVESYNVPPEYADMRLRLRSWRPHPRSGSAEVIRTKRPVQIDDLRTSPAYLEGDSIVRGLADVGGARTLIYIPMLKDDKLIGFVAIYRQEVRPFTDKQIALVQNFASQAVIAIENARLLRELNREREALARQHQADARYISWLRQLAGFLRHEVRQPVAQINSSVELIHLTAHDDQLKPYIASASQGVRHVWNLIERASRATDAEAFVRQGQAQPIDLPRLLRELIGSYQQTHSGIDFRLQLPDKEPVYISADPTLLKEAVSNLLANAASFADEESIIQVVLERDGVHAVIKVRNKGPIIQYDTEMLFGPFASTRSGPSSEHQGLGLYLVRLVAEHHGGKAIISNLDDGSGVEASIFLPL
jgi:GAF domain-containing protein